MTSVQCRATLDTLALDDEYLGKARAAARRIADLERELATAKADQAHAIRRLHLGGGSLREIAKAIGLSYQRVHQLVESTGDNGGITSRRRSKVTKAQLVCTFCGRDQSTVAKLIAGPSVFICDGCIALATAVADTRQLATNAFTAVAAIESGACSFCAKHLGDEGGRGTVTTMATAKSARICGECLALCHDILAEEPPPAQVPL